MNKKILVIFLVIGGLALLFVYGYKQNIFTASREEKRTVQKSSSDTNLSSAFGVTPTTSQTIALVSSPNFRLQITEPVNGLVVTKSTVRISVNTEPNADVFINDLETKANASGVFSREITLDEGENYILIFANNSDGLYAQKELSVTYNPAR